MDRKPRDDVEPKTDAPEAERESGEDIGFLPWVALVVLLACWLAEASL